MVSEVAAPVLTLVDVHDCDLDHPVGGQDLPYIGTLRVDGDVDAAVAVVERCPELDAFNVQRSKRLGLQGHIEFHTFEIDVAQRQFNPQYDDGLSEHRRFSRSLYVRTVGELRAVLADLPDDFPLLHTGFAGALERENRAGLHVQTGEWLWALPEDRSVSQQYWRSPSWSLRIQALDLDIWKSVVAGTWRDYHPGNDEPITCSAAVVGQGADLEGGTRDPHLPQ